MDFATIILLLISRDNLRNNQTRLIHHCLINNEKSKKIDIYQIKKTNKKTDNEPKTKTIYSTKLFQNTKRSFRN